MRDNLVGVRNRHHANSFSKQLNTISDMNLLESSKHLDPLGIFAAGEKSDSENQVNNIRYSHAIEYQVEHFLRTN